MSRQNILIIDDDQDQQQILGDHLNLAGFSAFHATSSKEGFATLKDTNVALILLDINMPEMDGFQTIEVLRNNPDTKNIPVLFLTSLDRQYLKIKGFELGADDYVTKPYNGAELMARIKAILRRNNQSSEQQSALNGDIKEIGFGDLLQSISGSSKTGILTFADMKGELILVNGKIISVKQGNAHGMEALLRLMLWEDGHFTVSYQTTSPPEFESDTAIPTIKALLNCVNEIDEIKMAVEKTTGQEDPLLTMVTTSTEDPAIDALHAKFPCHFIPLVTAMEGSLKENVYKVLKAIHSQQLLCLR